MSGSHAGRNGKGNQPVPFLRVSPLFIRRDDTYDLADRYKRRSSPGDPFARWASIIAILLWLASFLESHFFTWRDLRATVGFVGKNISPEGFQVTIAFKNGGNRPETVLGCHLAFPWDAQFSRSPFSGTCMVLEPFIVQPGETAVRQLVQPYQLSLISEPIIEERERRDRQIIGMVFVILGPEGDARECQVTLNEWQTGQQFLSSAWPRKDEPPGVKRKDYATIIDLDAIPTGQFLMESPNAKLVSGRIGGDD